MRRRKGDIRKENEARILAAAERLFAARGYAGTTTAAIALEANLPKANVHYYFATKQAIYRAVLERILRLWLSAFEPFTAADDPATALADYIRVKMRHSRDHPFASRIFASEILRGAPEIEGFLGGELKAWVARKARVIEAWIAAGRIEPIDPRQLFFTIWAITQHYADFAVQIRAVADPMPGNLPDGAMSRCPAPGGDEAPGGNDVVADGNPDGPDAVPCNAAAQTARRRRARMPSHLGTSGRGPQELPPAYLDAAAETAVRLVLKGLGLGPPARSAGASGGDLRRAGADDEALLPLRL